MLQNISAKYKKKLVGFLNKRVINRYNAASSLENWFYHWLYYQNMSHAKDYGPKNCYYEFGTGWGGTLTAFLKASIRFSNENNFDLNEIKIVLFDSFQGLPEITVKEDDHRAWGKGKFAYSRDYIKALIVKHNFPIQNVTFVEGFYEDSLTPQLLTKLAASPPSIITVDVDYYSSTKLVMDFIRPLLKSGAVFYFDDIHSFSLHPQMGQLKAISEFNQLDQGNLNWLTADNYAGQCYIYTSKVWEFGNKS